MIHKIGILSDTHISKCSEVFRQQVDVAFGDCQTIIHAGDLTNLGVLEVFSGKAVYAVHGNMCNYNTRNNLPESRVINLNGHSIAIFHGNGIWTNVEDRLLERFSEVDCIIYGHTHNAVKHVTAGILFINPGSFMGTSRYGSPGTYAILEVDEKRLSAAIHTLPMLS